MSTRGVVVWLVWAVGCAAPDAGELESGAPDRPLPDELGRRLDDGEQTVVLLGLDEGLLPALPAPGLRSVARRRALAERSLALGDLVDPLLEALPGDVDLVRRYSHVPQVALTLASRDAAERVLALPGVTGMDADVVVETTDAESFPMIGQPEATLAGFQGAGTAVAVLDTGADWMVADLGSCTAVGTPATCRVAYAADFAPSDGSRDNNGHGTNVSAIVAGVAPQTDILALDVFNGSLAYSTDIIAALNWVVANEATYGIAAVNMSLGSGSFTAPCTDVFSSAITSVRAADIAVVVASGNNAYTNAVASPACNAGAITVGAVYDSNLGGMAWSGCSDSSSAADKVTCFSNAASFLDILAPGALISQGGYTMGGTSQASPHVAGAVAVMRAAHPTDTIDDIESALESTGVTVTDHRNGLTFPRLDLAAAVSDCITSVSPLVTSAAGDGDSGTISVDAPAGCTWTVDALDDWLTVDVGGGTGPGDVTWTADANHETARVGHVDVSGRAVAIEQEDAVPPTGTVSIAGGAEGTASTAVTVTLASDGAAEVCLSNTASCSTWVAYEVELPWTLASGAGTKTVYAKFRDAWGNEGDAVSDTIVLDTTAPTNGAVTVTPGNGELTVSWTGFADAASGIAGYRVMSATGTAAPTNCTTGTPAWEGDDDSATLTGLTNGTTYALRVCAVDGAGNVSGGATRTGRPVPETDAPAGTVVMTGVGDYTRSTTVTLGLAATDASGVTEACVSNTSTCSAWFAMTPTKAWTLSGGTGSRTVYAFYKDTWGNVSAAVTDSVVLDAAVPTNGTVTAVPSSGQAVLSWSGFADTVSGVASYKVVQATSATAPANCSGAAVWTGTDTTATRTGLTNGSTYSWRVCAVDNAGNLSTGAVVSARPAPEYDAPTGTVSLNAGATWTKATAVTASLAATDASGVTHACLSNTTAACTAWFPMTASKTWSLTGSAGTKTVYVYFKDTWGNVSVAASDTIQLDNVVPVNGTVTAAGASGEVALSWSGFSDAASGVAGYRVVYAAGVAPTNCNGATAYAGTSTSTTVTGLTNGATYGFRVCAEDTAGNRSTGALASARPAPEYVAPVGTIELAGGAAWTGATSLTATLAATDVSGVTHACLSNATTPCNAWFAMTSSKTWSLTGSTGTKTVYAYFKDAYGNVSAATSDTIGLDLTTPTNGTVTGTPGSGSVALSWSGFSDAHSGLAGYRVVYAAGTTAPASCAGTPAWEGTGTSTTISSLTSGSAVSFRVCAVDAVGKIGTGSRVTVTPQ